MGVIAKKNVIYAGAGGADTADKLKYDNTVSGLNAEEVQGALDELASNSANIEEMVSELSTKVDDSVFEQITDAEINAITS